MQDEIDDVKDSSYKELKCVLDKFQMYWMKFSSEISILK
jgi:hypothetical protein